MLIKYFVLFVGVQKLWRLPLDMADIPGFACCMNVIPKESFTSTAGQRKIHRLLPIRYTTSIYMELSYVGPSTQLKQPFA